MPNWNDVLNEIKKTKSKEGQSPLDLVRRKYLARLAKTTGRNVIAYYSAFLSKPNVAGTEINDDDKNGLMLCIHELKREAGLDLILHTAGGTVAAAESFVHYLKQMFGNDVRAIVPQICMSAGTLIACSCKEILMGKHSNLGPVDPQLDGFPALAVTEQFDEAFKQIVADARAADAWQPILQHLGPSLLKECEWAIDRSKGFLIDVLKQNMLASDPNPAVKAEEIQKKLMDVASSGGHDRHFHFNDCIGMGLAIKMIEDDPSLQDDILTVHHCFMHTTSNSAAVKIIENHLGRALLKNETATLPQLSIGFAPPPPAP
ncbi:MAG: S49 family peptidase [Pseudomonadota bacterium]